MFNTLFFVYQDYYHRHLLLRSSSSSTEEASGSQRHHSFRPALTGIDLKVPQGALVAVVGQVNKCTKYFGFFREISNITLPNSSVQFCLFPFARLKFKCGNLCGEIPLPEIWSDGANPPTRFSLFFSALIHRSALASPPCSPPCLARWSGWAAPPTPGGRSRTSHSRHGSRTGRSGIRGRDTHGACSLSINRAEKSSKLSIICLKKIYGV